MADDTSDPPQNLRPGSVGAFRQRHKTYLAQRNDNFATLCPPEEAARRTPEQKRYVEKLLTGEGAPLHARTGLSDTLKRLTREEFIQITKLHLENSRISTSIREDEDTEVDRFFLIQSDNRPFPRRTSDTELSKAVSVGIANIITHSQGLGLEFDSKCVESSIECTYFSTQKTQHTHQQIGVICHKGSGLAHKMCAFASERPDVRVLLGKTNIRFRIVREKPEPHVKVTVRVTDEDLLLDREGSSLSLAMLIRLEDEEQISLLRAGYVGKSNVFEWTLSGETLPPELVTNNIMKVHHNVMYMRFPAGPFPCRECHTFDHSTLGCQVYKDKKKMERCLECSETGHSRAACPKREPPKCFACHQPGHFKMGCPNIKCFKCDKPGHMSKHCSSGRGAAASRKAPPKKKTTKKGTTTQKTNPAPSQEHTTTEAEEAAEAVAAPRPSSNGSKDSGKQSSSNAGDEGGYVEAKKDSPPESPSLIITRSRNRSRSGRCSCVGGHCTYRRSQQRYKQQQGGCEKENYRH